MKIKNFTNNLPQNFQLIFDYHSINTEELSEQIEGIIENTDETQQKIIYQIQWLFQTNDSTYYILGLLNNKLYFMDTEGGFSDSEYDIYNLPFLLNSSPFDFSEAWEKKSRMHKGFFGIFYCDKNNIHLLPEHLRWKDELKKYVKR